MRNKKVVEIKDFSNFNDKNEGVKVKRFYNYLPTSTLKNSKGVKIATFPQNMTDLTEKPLNLADSGIEKVEGIAYFKQYYSRTDTINRRLLIYAGDKKVYINQLLDDMFDALWLYELTFNTLPIVLEYRKDNDDVVILASEDSMKVWKTGYSPYTIIGAPIITSMCMNEGVLFCSIKDPAYKIWYATDLDPEKVGNISSVSGYVSLDNDLGYARKVITFNEDVYVFRDYGISKINFIKNEVSVSQIYSSNTKIYANTVSVCGNSILFMTKEGLYSFNGIKVTKTKIDFLNSFSVDNDGAVASSLGEKYYLALRVEFDDEDSVLCEQNECVNNVLFVVDTNDFTYEILRGIDVKTIVPVKTEVFEKMLVTFNSVHTDKIGEIVEVSKCFDENLPKCWESENLVEDYGVKLFTKLTAWADKNVKFTLEYDGKEVDFTAYNSGINEFVFKICCKDVKLKISSNEESAIVKSVALDYYEY